jgi:hypothetical protein
MWLARINRAKANCKEGADPQPPLCANYGALILNKRSTFTSRTILPVSSTMQMLVSSTDTSGPAKWSMLRFSF